MKTSSTRVSRRHFLKAGTVAAGAAFLAACAPAGQPSTPAAESGAVAGEQRQLRLSAWADVQDAVVYENMVNRWHETQDEFRVSVEQYPGGYYERIQANFAAGNAADVLYYQGWQWQAYAENMVLAALDGYIERDEEVSSAFPDTENYRNTTQWHGQTYMTPTDVGSLVVYYNKDLFDMREVPYPERGWKWEDFQQIIQQLSFEEGNTRYYGWAQAGGWAGGYGRNVSFMRRNGHVEWDQVVEPTRADWVHEDVISAFQFLICDAIENQWSPGPEVIAGGGVGVDTGRVAMVLEGPWYMPRLWGELATTEEGINYDVVEPPVGELDENLSFGHVHGHSITAESGEPEGAWELVKFILSDEGQEIIATGGRMCGTPENIENIWGPIASETYNFTNVEAFANGMRQGSTPLIMGEGSQIHAYGGGPITSMWDAMLGLQMNAEEAVTQANSEIQRLLDEYWQERT